MQTKLKAVSKKRKEATKSTLQVLEDLEGHLKAAKARLQGQQRADGGGGGGGGQALGEVRQKLSAAVRDADAMGRVKSAHKALHASISKLGKALEKVKRRVCPIVFPIFTGRAPIEKANYSRPPILVSFDPRRIYPRKRTRT